LQVLAFNVNYLSWASSCRIVSVWNRAKRYDLRLLAPGAGRR
jgi:hypothetical protein